MPGAEPTNPYTPPEAVPPRRPRRPLSGSGTITRIIAVVAGFSLLADPGAIPIVGALANGIAHGRFAARVVGFACLIAAFLPWRGDARRDRPPEDL